jgi:predicted 3-demethylubiquinone-9 3-methyltransferase (glyoxalase superfamily)
MRSITPCLWFDDRLEEALDFYTSVFPGGKVHGTTRYPDGRILTADFELAGMPVKALNGGPEFRFTEAISMFVECDGQDEIDHYWSVLTADGGEEGPCGWLKDKYGLSWQIVSAEVTELMSSADAHTMGRLMGAISPMKKLDVATLQAAARS